MQPFQQLVVEEKRELDDKLEMLGIFIEGKVLPSLPQLEQDRLRAQYSVMRDYSNILGQRIENFQ